MSAEALIEEGVGETRYALVEHGRIVEAEVERADDTLRAGAVHSARLLRPGYVAIDGIEALIDAVPPDRLILKAISSGVSVTTMLGCVQ